MTGAKAIPTDGRSRGRVVHGPDHGRILARGPSVVSNDPGVGSQRRKQQ